MTEPLRRYDHTLNRPEAYNRLRFWVSKLFEGQSRAAIELLLKALEEDEQDE